MMNLEKLMDMAEELSRGGTIPTRLEVDVNTWDQLRADIEVGHLIQTDAQLQHAIMGLKVVLIRDGNRRILEMK